MHIILSLYIGGLCNRLSCLAPPRLRAKRRTYYSKVPTIYLLYAHTRHSVTHESDLTRRFVIVTQVTDSCNNNNNNMTCHIITYLH